MWQIIMGKIPFGDDVDQMGLIYQVGFKRLFD